jgi:hypothetical protein
VFFRSDGTTLSCTNTRVKTAIKSTKYVDMCGCPKKVRGSGKDRRLLFWGSPVSLHESPFDKDVSDDARYKSSAQ